MKTILTILVLAALAALAVLVAPWRRTRVQRPRAMDAATYAAMVAEAERIAAPFRIHVDAALAALYGPPDEAPGDDFSDVEALLARAGLLEATHERK